MNYTPKSGSIAHQTIALLTANPGASITPKEVALKFGKPIGQISSFLHIAIHAGSIKRTINADGGLVYILGEGAPQPITPNVSAAPYTPGKPRTVWVEVPQRKKVAA